jgi:glutamate 5-kinase
MRIVVKIGSNVLTRVDGSLDVTRISALVDQVAELKRIGVEVILVSSGAVASGRKLLSPQTKLDVVSARQLFSAIGQVKLLNHYYDFFHQYNIVCGQILATKEDFSTRRHYLNQRNCIEVMLDHDVIPIINENDAISVNELMFTDNDELSGLVATMVGAEKLIILSNIDGIFSGHPDDEGSRLIREIRVDRDDLSQYIQRSKSSNGRGGMITKYNIARKVAEEGIEVIIANGKRANILVDLIQNQETTCSRFLPLEEKTSSVKKWIAHSDSFAKGEVYVNQGAKEMLLGSRAVSLLMVGVTHIEGEFETDDIVRIMDENKNQIGVGKTAYDSRKAISLIGKSGSKPIVHYNYLYIEK